MYAEHVPIIKRAMRRDVETFARGAMFAILSARTQFNRVPDQCQELAQRGADASCLWGWKFNAFAYVEANKLSLWRNVTVAIDTRAALWNITRIPGMGIVKGAFVCQMLGHDIACLDTRNIAADGRDPRAYRADGEDRKVGPAFWRKINRYIADTGGKAEQYWNSWCRMVGPDYGMTAEQISWLHVTTIVPKRLRRVQPTQSYSLEETF